MATQAGPWGAGDLILGTYRVLKVHGEAATGLVYQVRHLDWQVDLAMKGTRPELSEAETWVGLGLHPHVCACHYVRLIDGVPYVFAEYVEGGSLREWIDDGRLYAGGPKRALARILDVAIQVAWGLGHAHRQGVAHLDVKPGNVLLGPGNIAKVTGFGLARPFAGRPAGGGRHDPQVTVAGLTPAYASPEQAADGRAGKTSDVWSFAVTVLECFTGEVRWSSGPAAGTALAEVRLRGSGERDARVPGQADWDRAGSDRPARVPGQAGLDRAARVPGQAGSDRAGSDREAPGGGLPGGGRSVSPPPLPPALADLLARCLAPAYTERPRDLAAVAGELARIHRAEIGRRYDRTPPRPARLRADELNNRGLSLLDLGRPEEAVADLREALAADPRHLAATVNLGLLAWRRGDVTDRELVDDLATRLADSAEPEQAALALARVHAERGDPDAAAAALGTGSSERPETTAAGPEAATSSTPGTAAAGTPGTAAAGRPGDVLARPGRRLAGGAGHAGWVRAVDVSADGRLGISGGQDGTARLWDVTTGRCLATLTGHTAEVGAVRLSADGRIAITGSQDDTARVWDTASGACLHVLDQHTSHVSAVAVTADGRTAVTGGGDTTLRVWDTRTGVCVRVLTGHTTPIDALCVSADGRHALAAELQSYVLVWDLAEGRPTARLESEHRRAGSVSLSADGGVGAVCAGGVVWLWDLAGGELRHLLDGAGELTRAALSADGRWLLTGGEDKTVRWWQVETGRCVRTFDGHRGMVTGVALSADGRFGVSAGGWDETVGLWQLPEPVEAPLMLCRPRSTTDLSTGAARVKRLLAEAVAAGRPGDALARLTEAREVPGHERDAAVRQAWRDLSRHTTRTGLADFWTLRTITAEPPMTQAAVIVPGGRLAVAFPVAFGGGDNRLRVWDLETGDAVRTLAGHTDAIGAVGVDPAGRWALSGGRDRTARLWDLTTGASLRTLTGHTGAVDAVCLTSGPGPTRDGPASSGDGQALAGDAREPTGGGQALSGGADGEIRVWDLGTGACVRTLTGHDGAVTSLAAGPGGPPTVSANPNGPPTASAGPTGRIAVSGGQDGSVRVWDLADGTAGPVFTGHDGPVRSVGLSADGAIAVSGGADHTVRVWDLGTGRVRHVLTGHTDRVTTVRVTGDGLFAVSGGHDQTIRVWQLGDGECVAVLAGHTAAVASLDLSVDGFRLLSAGWDRTLRLWELDWRLASGPAAIVAGQDPPADQ